MRNGKIFISVTTFLYLFLNILINYVSFNKLVLILIIISNIVISCFFTVEYLDYKKRIFTFIVSMLIIIGIHFLSAFLFESGMAFAVRKPIDDGKYSLIKLYSYIGFFIVQNTLNYLLYAQKTDTN